MLEDKNQSTSNLEQLGEFGLIDHLTNGFENKEKSTLKGIGDDAAVLDHGNEKTVVSTDMLVEGVHFDVTYVPLKHLGYKSVVVNLSDIYAMNATPKQVTVSIAVSSRYSVEALEEIYAGIKQACEFYNVDLIGGDTTSSLKGLVISVTAIGSAPEEKLAYRSGAKEHDLICVSGDLGGAYMGLQVLEREKAVFRENPQMQPDMSGSEYVLERQLKPEARRDVIKILGEMHVIPTSMIDVSDGLASEIMHICKQSEVGAQIYEEKIPIDYQTYKTAEEFNFNATTAALNGGEDYELLFTISQKDYDVVKGIPGISVIGHIADKESGVSMVARGEQVVELQAQGWNAFKNKSQND
ncbi:thiamine-phosphate kinase [bacterium SCSIO 12643]|nr:thiamine-phosphate kinase [bacterium SCSIO 12643]